MKKLMLILLVLAIFILPLQTANLQDSPQPLIVTGFGEYELEWSPDGQQLFSMVYYGSAYLIDAKTGEGVLEFNVLRGVPSGFLNPQGSRFATLNWQSYMDPWDIQIWDTATGAPISTFRIMNRVATLRWSPNNRWLFTGDGVFDTATGQLILDINAFGAVWSRDGQRVLAWNDEGAQIWDVATETLLFNRENQYVFSALWNADETQILLGTYQGTEIWNLEANHLETSVASVGFSFRWSYDEEFVLTYLSKRVYLWRVSDGAQVAVLPHLYTPEMLWSPNDLRFLTRRKDMVYVWDGATGELLHELSLPDAIWYEVPVGGMQWIEEGAYIAQWATDGTVRIWDSATGELTCLFQHVYEDGTAGVKGPTSVAIHEASHHIATGMMRTINIWDYSSCIG